MCLGLDTVTLIHIAVLVFFLSWVDKTALLRTKFSNSFSHIVLIKKTFSFLWTDDKGFVAYTPASCHYNILESLLCNKIGI